MYPGDKCVMCDHPSLFISRPEREPHSIIIYGRNGSMVGAYYVKNCWRCNTQHFPAYVEFEDGAAVKTRRYYNGEVPYFHVSPDTFFTADLLEEVTHDLTVLMANFTAITEKYNEMNGENKTRETCRIHLP